MLLWLLHLNPVMNTVWTFPSGGLSELLKIVEVIGTVLVVCLVLSGALESYKAATAWSARPGDKQSRCNAKQALWTLGIGLVILALGFSITVISLLGFGLWFLFRFVYKWVVHYLSVRLPMKLRMLHKQTTAEFSRIKKFYTVITTPIPITDDNHER